MRTQLWTWYPNILWVLCESWTTSNSVRSPHRPPYVHKLHFRHAHLLPWFLNIRAWTIDLISSIVVQGWWYLYGHAIPLFYECYMKHVQRLQAWISKQTMSWPPTTTRICSDVTLHIRTKSLHHGTHQWCSHCGLSMMIPGCIWYATVLWVLYEAWTLSDRGGSPHRLRHSLQLHPWHT